MSARRYDEMSDDELLGELSRAFGRDDPLPPRVAESGRAAWEQRGQADAVPSPPPGCAGWWRRLADRWLP